VHDGAWPNLKNHKFIINSNALSQNQSLAVRTVTQGNRFRFLSLMDKDKQFLGNESQSKDYTVDNDSP
jgi:hypothetical protein